MGLDQESRIITCPDDVRNIPDKSARIAASILLELHPGQIEEIGYETTRYPNDERLRGTRPDLSVSLTNGEQFFLEATKSNKKWYVQTLRSLPIWLGKSDVSRNENGGIDLLTVLMEHDPKGRQRRVMQSTAPDVDYRVWYGNDLTVLRKVTKRNKKKNGLQYSEE